ncbi:MAG TPA: PIG-L family deacetylase [Polyangiaceae bacterium]|nr:PIG-L family deacetylase [Polyangiaceae bacterium]
MVLELGHPQAVHFVPDGAPLEAALARTTHLGIGAHQDDLELMASSAILECFARADRWFSGVVVTDGGNSPRAGAYAAFDAAAMREVRRREQDKAAHIGEYSVQLQLGYPSAAVKGNAAAVVDDLERVLLATRPEQVFTHSLSDRHDTHVAVVLRVLAACRRLPSDALPQRLVGCEVWGDLDWLPAAERVALPLGSREHLQSALLGVFDSQLEGGKRYDLAAIGRRRAHATFSESHDVDRLPGLVWAMDLTRLLREGDPAEHVDALVASFRAEVMARLARVGG